MFTADSERIVWWLVGGTGELRQWSQRRKLLAMMWLKKLCSISPRLRVSSYYGPFYGVYYAVLSVCRYFYEGITLMSHNSCLGDKMASDKLHANELIWYHKTATAHSWATVGRVSIALFNDCELWFFSELAIIRTQCIDYAGVANTQHAQIAIFKIAIYLEKPEMQLFYYTIKTRPTVDHKYSG